MKSMQSWRGRTLTDCHLETSCSVSSLSPIASLLERQIEIRRSSSVSHVVLDGREGRRKKQPKATKTVRRPSIMNCVCVSGKGEHVTE